MSKNIPIMRKKFHTSGIEVSDHPTWIIIILVRLRTRFGIANWRVKKLIRQQ
jgi:hypothetical protein